jgi:membrane protein implicated in regulation of membrane protease activity
VGSRRRRDRAEIPIDLVLVIILAVVIGAALVWAAKGSLYWTALIIVFVLGALMWAYARRIRRREDMSADQQRKVRHDSSWTSEREEE